MVSGGFAIKLSMTRAAIRATPLVLRRSWRKANSSRQTCRFLSRTAPACVPSSFGLLDSVEGPLAQAFLTVASMPVRYDLCVGRDLLVGKAFERAGVIVLDVGEAHPSVGCRGDQNQLLVRPALSPDERLVELLKRAERLAVGVDHRRAQFVQPAPGRLVGAEPQDALQVLARYAGAPRRDLEHRAETCLERLAGLLLERPRRQARLVPAVGALEHEAIALRPPPLAGAASTVWLAAPARPDPVRMAIRLSREPRIELLRSLGKVTPKTVVVVVRHPLLVGTHVA